MNEQEWLRCPYPDVPLAFLRPRASDRKLRLFVCACCRRIEYLLSLPEFIRTVDVAERFADGVATDEERQRAFKVVDKYNWSHPPERDRFRWSDWAVAAAAENWSGHDCDRIERARRIAERAREALERDDAYRLLLTTGPSEPKLQFPHSRDQFEEYLRARGAVSDFEDAQRRRLHGEEAARQVAFLHDIFGNPFRSAAVDPAWLTTDVLALAEGIYADRAFNRLPILADALQDAGCDSDDILGHCRDAALTHVRGCWVIDLLTGRG